MFYLLHTVDNRALMSFRFIEAVITLPMDKGLLQIHDGDYKKRLRPERKIFTKSRKKIDLDTPKKAELKDSTGKERNICGHNPLPSSNFNNAVNQSWQ